MTGLKYTVAVIENLKKNLPERSETDETVNITFIIVLCNVTSE